MKQQENHFIQKYIPPNYSDGFKNEQSLKHVIQTEYRGLLNRHVPDFFVLVHGRNFMKDGNIIQLSRHLLICLVNNKQNVLYNEHIEELRKVSRQKLIDERLIPIMDLLITDQKMKLSRNWDYICLQMQKHPRYSSTVIPASLWSDFESNNSLTIPDDFTSNIRSSSFGLNFI